MDRLFKPEPWAKLTRAGIPTFRVIRHSITTQGVRYAVGDIFPESAAVNRSRLRQMYEQRWIEPVYDEKRSESVGTTTASVHTHREPASVELPSVSAPVSSPLDSKKRVKARQG